MTEDQIRDVITQWKARIERCRRIRDERAALGEDALARSWHEEADTIEDFSRQLERLLLAERPQEQQHEKENTETQNEADHAGRGVDVPVEVSGHDTLRSLTERPQPQEAPMSDAQDDIGLTIDMLDVDRLRDWARLLLVHGADIGHWGSVTYVAGTMQILATNIERAIRDIGTLRSERTPKPLGSPTP